jgi:hypothetical protein
MKTFALVELGGVRHMVDDFEMAKGMRDEALARGVKLILCKPMETIIEANWLAAIEASVKRGEAANTTELGAMIMSAIDNLRTEVEALRAEVADNKTKHQATLDKVAEQTAKANEAIEKLAAASAGFTNEAEIQGIADDLRGITKDLDSVTAEPKAAEPAPADPAPVEPAPEPAPETPV